MTVLNQESSLVRPHLLWLEDESTFVSAMKDNFEQAHQVTVMESFHQLKNASYDLLNSIAVVVLDLNLLEGAIGVEAIDLLRLRKCLAPIVVLSKDETHQTRMKFLSLGVEDYIWKSMHAEEIALRVHNAAKRFQERKVQQLSLSGLEIQPLNFTVMLQGSELDLTRLELRLIGMLIQKFPQALNFEELRQEVWRTQLLERGTIYTTIWKLNKKLGTWSYRLMAEQASVMLTENK